MKRKDDDLLRLAFGELSGETARTIEMGADASDRAEIEALRRLREGLDALPTPPPDGLSAERLRAAILDRELRGRRSRFSWGGFLLAPAALVALATLVILPRLRPRTEPQLLGFDNVRSETLKAPTGFGFGSRVALNDAMPASPSQSQVTARVVPSRRARTVEEVATRSLRRRHHSIFAEPEGHRLDNALVMISSEEEPSGLLAPAPAAASTSLATKRPEPETIAAPPSTVVEARPGQGGKTQTVVLVSGQRDLETGAPAATEKEAVSVLVGG